MDGQQHPHRSRWQSHPYGMSTLRHVGATTVTLWTRLCLPVPSLDHSSHVIMALCNPGKSGGNSVVSPTCTFIPCHMLVSQGTVTDGSPSSPRHEASMLPVFRHGRPRSKPRAGALGGAGILPSRSPIRMPQLYQQKQEGWNMNEQRTNREY